MVFLFYYLKKYENRMRFFGIMSAKQTIIKVKSIENQMINNAFKYPRRRYYKTFLYFLHP